jgi:hypothetical protein
MVVADAQGPISRAIVEPSILKAAPKEPPPADWFLLRPGPLPAFQYPMGYQKRNLPPPEYDHEYTGHLILLRSTLPLVLRACRKAKIKSGHMPMGWAQAHFPNANSCTLGTYIADAMQRIANYKAERAKQKATGFENV